MRDKHCLETSSIAMVLLLLILCRSAVAVAATVDPSKLPAAATRPVDFAKDIQPLFADRCYSCHGSGKQESAFRLDQKVAALKGACALLGIGNGIPAQPYEPVTAEQRAAIAALLRQHGVRAAEAVG